MEFRDRTVLITGAATGIGRSLALALAREGADLALLDVDAENGVETAERPLHQEPADWPERHVGRGTLPEDMPSWREFWEERSREES